MIIFVFLSIIVHATNCYDQHDKEPYFLPTGEAYRDKVTLETAKNAAKFAKSLKLFESKEGERTSAIKGVKIKTPEFIGLQDFKFGESKPDYEIFGYVDSRFLNPPLENRKNKVTLTREYGENIGEFVNFKIA